MILFPNAKINIGLSVLGRRTDGFHNIRTVMYPVPYCDVLEVLPASGSATSLILSGISLDGDHEENLCYQAWEMMQAEYGIDAVDMHLHKAIPPGAGLGGGSSDGVSTLQALNMIFDLKLEDDQVHRMAARLGSDCPFFVRNSSALAVGRGDVLQPLDIDLKGLYLLMVKPSLHISTARAYSHLATLKDPGKSTEGELPEGNPMDRVLHTDDDGYMMDTASNPVRIPVDEWRERIKNDFEQALFDDYPVLAEMKQKLYDMEAVYASMTGSGSALYGLFKGKPMRQTHFQSGELLWHGWL